MKPAKTPAKDSELKKDDLNIKQATMNNRKQNNDDLLLNVPTTAETTTAQCYGFTSQKSRFARKEDIEKYRKKY